MSMSWSAMHLYISFLSLYNGEASSTPEPGCFMDGDVLTCHLHIPATIPNNATAVIVKDFGQIILNSSLFNHPNWQNVRKLELNKRNNISPDRIFINAYTFQRLLHLEYLAFHTKWHLNFSQDALAGLDNLKELDFSGCTRLTCSHVAETLSRDVTLPKLTSVRLQEVNTEHNRFCVMDDRLMEAFQKQRIAYLDVSGTKLEIKAEKGRLHVVELNISHVTPRLASSLSFKDYFPTLMPDVKAIDASWIPKQYAAVIPLIMEGANETSCPWYFRFEVIRLNHNFKAIILNNSIVDMSACSDFRLKHLELVGNSIETLNATILYPAILQKTFRYLDVASNSIRYVAPKFWNDLVAMETLNLSANQLSAMESLPEFEYIFASLKNLRHVDLSHNQLTIIPEGMFISNSELLEINLSDNNLESVLFSIHHLNELRKLFLRRNKIKSLDGQTSLTIQNICLRQVANLEHGLQTYMDGNGFVHTCETQSLTEWLVSLMQGSDQHFCELERLSIVVDTASVCWSDKTCTRYAVITYTCLVLLPVVVVFVSKCRERQCLKERLLVDLYVQKMKTSQDRLARELREREALAHQRVKHREEVFIEDYLQGKLETHMVYVMCHRHEKSELINEVICEPLTQELHAIVMKNHLGLSQNVTLLCSDSYIEEGRSIFEKTVEFVSTSRVIVYVLSEEMKCDIDERYKLIFDETTMETPMLLIRMNDVQTPDELAHLLKRCREYADLSKLDNGYILTPDWEVFGKFVFKWAVRNYQRD